MFSDFCKPEHYKALDIYVTAHSEAKGEMMDLCKYPLDLILVPLSLFLTLGYHTCLWHSSKAKNPSTAVGLITMKRISWAHHIVQDTKKNGMLGVQSLRNPTMAAVLSATAGIQMVIGLAAMLNNTYKYSGHLLHHSFFGSQGGPTVVLKYASISLLLLLSFLANSVAIWCTIEGNFLINVSEGEEDLMFFHKQAVRLLKRGFWLALVGSRVLYMTLPALLWLFGPVPMALSSVALVWLLYNLDFAGTGLRGTNH